MAFDLQNSLALQTHIQYELLPLTFQINYDFPIVSITIGENGQNLIDRES